MKIQVEYMGQIRLKLKKKEELVEVAPTTTLQDLLNQLSKTYGEWFSEEVFESPNRKLRDGLVVTVNGIASKQIEGLKTRLKKGDIIAIIPIFAGGG